MSNSPQFGLYKGCNVSSQRTSRVSVQERGNAYASSADVNSQAIGRSSLSTELAFFFASNPVRHSKLLRMLASGLNPNEVGSTGDTLLHHVIRIGQFDLIATLINHGARIDALNRDGQTPFELYRALGGDRVKDLALLQIKAKKESNLGRQKAKSEVQIDTFPRKKGGDFRGALVESHIRKGHTKTVRSLLNRGLDPNARLRSGRSLLGVAVEARKEAIVDLLLQHGADPLQKDISNQNPMQLAQKRGLVDINYKLLCASIRRSDSSEAAGDGASMKEQAKISQPQLSIRELDAKTKSAVFSDDAKPKSLTNPKESAAQAKFQIPANDLNLGGTAPIVVSAASGAMRPVDNSRRFSEASFYIRKSRTKDLAHLLETGLDPNASLSNGHSLLHVAVETYCLAIIELLLEHGADPKREDASGVTAIKVAQNLGRADLAYMLHNAKIGQEVNRPVTPKTLPASHTVPVVTSSGLTAPQTSQETIDPSYVVPIEDEEEVFNNFEEDNKGIPGVPVPFTTNDGGIFVAIDDSDDEEDADLVSGLGDVLVSVKRSPVQEETRSAVGLHWGDCIIDKENFDDAWESLSLLPVPIDEKKWFRRWCTEERPDVKEFFEHAEMMHMLALYAKSYLARR